MTKCEMQIRELAYDPLWQRHYVGRNPSSAQFVKENAAVPIPLWFFSDILSESVLFHTDSDYACNIH